MRKIMLKPGDNPLTMDIPVARTNWLRIFVMGLILLLLASCAGLTYYAYTMVSK